MLSGGGRSLINLLDSDAMTGPSAVAECALVIASREVAGAQKARERGIPTVVLPGQIPAAELGKLLVEHAVDLVVLAGYLKKIEIPAGFEGRVINIHPALLPKFGGKGLYGHFVHEAVLQAKEQESGCTVHYCDAKYDTGPIILQRRCAVLPGDTPDSLAARVFAEECIALPEALKRVVGTLDLR